MLAARPPKSAHVETNVMNDVIAAEVFELFCTRDGIGHGHVVAHHFRAEIASGFHYQFDSFLMRLTHNYHHASASFGHHFGLEPTAVHGFQVGNDGYLRIAGAQLTNAAHPFGNDQGRADLKPIDSGADRHIGGTNRFSEVD